MTVEFGNEPWEPSIREAIRGACEQGRVSVVVVYGWELPSESSDFAAPVLEGVNGNEAQGAGAVNGSGQDAPVNREVRP